MAYAHISIVGTEHGDDLKAYRDALALVIVNGPLILSQMSKMIDQTPDPDDYSYLETQFGLPGGTGTALYGELNTVVTALKADPASGASTAGDAALLATKLKQFIDMVG